ncbi:MAG: AAA-like domain protein [candidate division WS6 bacterium OLB20]|uniref:AAA-like domain protein n=1 Tax=candidate division WS6 bacterium OLB20 TaxID=1617426 RepID=A0A136LZM2_9BACT|nr:MAG: AAA-like domain protein [candidate division WS6 bacterium OLB20]
MKARTDSEGKKIQLESGESAELREVETKNSKVGFQFVVRLMVLGPDKLIAQQILEDIEASYKQFQTGQFNSLVKKKEKKGMLRPVMRLLFGRRRTERLDLRSKYKLRFLDERSDDVINTEELASLYHLPNETVETPNIVWAKSRKLEFPKNLPFNQGRIFAKTDYRNLEVPFGIRDMDRRRHMYILGKTGSGKSTLLKNMIIADIREGKGLAVIDPHGDLVEDVLRYTPLERANDIVYLDPSDMMFPIGINMLDLKESETIELLSDGIVSVFKRYFDSWGPRLQYILTNTILTLLHCQNVSLLAVQRILVDENYRTFLLKQVKDPFLVQFWEKEFADMAKNPRMLTEAIAPIQNKVGRFLNSPMVRNMVGQVKSRVDLEDIMNSGKVLLVNLSQGKIGEENSSLLGGMLVTRLYTNAMQRARMAESERRDFYVYVDEFQNFATDSFAKILSEARKYALNLVVTHQYVDQISEELQSAIFGNVGTMLNFVVGQADAARLAKEFEPYLDSEDLVNLERHALSIKLMVDGTQSVPFTAKSLAPFHLELGFQEQIKEASRSNYATERAVIEEKLNKWSLQRYNSKGNLIQDGGREQNDRPAKKQDDTKQNAGKASEDDPRSEETPSTGKKPRADKSPEPEKPGQNKNTKPVNDESSGSAVEP